jgi:hypothetical protein
MAPQEVAGLQALAMAHGGKLTINPDTGLPEAGFLSKILPTLIGAGLSFIPGVGPLLAAGIVGGGTTLATGSLKKGLMAGLGAYGGAGLAGSIAGAGTSAGLNAAAGEAALAGDAAAQAAQTQLSAATATPLANAATAAPVAGAVTTNPFAATPNLLEGTVDQIAKAYDYIPPPAATAPVPAINAGSVVPTVTTPPAIPAPTSIADQYAQMKAAGLSNEQIMQSAKEFAADTAGTAASPFSATTQKALSSPFSAGFEALKADPSKFMTKDNLKYGLAGLGPMLMGDEEKPKGSGPNPYEYSYDYRTGSYTRQAPGYRDAQTVTPPRAMADGGPVQAMSDRNDAQMMMVNRGQMFARGGISHLGDYSDGGRMLRGPGDGVSDSIPASIGGKRPARLADGEFVVPARIVSEIGNGSSEAGARKLYAMMDRVQKARKKSIGKNKVAVNSRSEKLLPA